MAMHLCFISRLFVIIRTLVPGILVLMPMGFPGMSMPRCLPGKMLMRVGVSRWAGMQVLRFILAFHDQPSSGRFRNDLQRREESLLRRSPPAVQDGRRGLGVRVENPQVQ
jgi:hypothetical protein